MTPVTKSAMIINPAPQASPLTNTPISCNAPCIRRPLISSALWRVKTLSGKFDICKGALTGLGATGAPNHR